MFITGDGIKYHRDHSASLQTCFSSLTMMSLLGRSRMSLPGSHLKKIPKLSTIEMVFRVTSCLSGPREVQGHTQNLLLSSHNDNMLFRSNGEQTLIGPDKLRITGTLTSLTCSSFSSPFTTVVGGCLHICLFEVLRFWENKTVVNDGNGAGVPRLSVHAVPPVRSKHRNELIHQSGPAHTPSHSSSPSGPEGALFQHSVEVPLLRSELFKDLR